MAQNFDTQLWDDMPRMLPRLLSLNAGFVDAATFLALKGLFAAHVTGNFVTLGAALVLGSSGALAKLLALPVFMVVVFGARLCSYRLQARSLPILGSLLWAELLLLVAGAMLATRYGPFSTAAGFAAVATGMVLVAAMAVQNAAHRAHLPNAPPSTVMTSTTTQIMMDCADLAHGLNAAKAAPIKKRLRQMTISALAFALGCTLGALFYAWLGVLCFWGPPVLVLATLALRGALAEGDRHHTLTGNA